MSLFSEEGGGAVPVVVYQLTAGQLEELVEKIAVRVAAGPRPAAVKIGEAARLLNLSDQSVRRRVEAKLIARLPDMGPIRIPMAEIDRLNGLAAEKRPKR